MRARGERLLDRVQRTTPVRVVMAFGESQASNFASALAFQGFLSMFPMILGALAIVGFAIRDPSSEAHAQHLIIQAFPSSAHVEMAKALHGVKQSAGLLGVVSLGGLIWSASSIFGTMEFVLTEIFGTRQRDLVRQKLMGLVMMAVLVVAVVALVGVNSLTGYLPLPGSVAWIPTFIAGAMVMIALLVVIYRFVPNRSFELRDVMPGALLAGVLIEALSLGFGLYAKFAGHFNTYGATFGLFFLLATWFYLLSELLLLGAVYNKFRMGVPDRGGVVAAPDTEAHKPSRPVDAIRKHQAEASAEGRPPSRPPRSLFQRVALPVAVALAVAGGVLRRRRRRAA